MIVTGGCKRDDGSTLATYCQGARSKQVVFFMHGLFLDARMWEPMFESLAGDGLQLIAYDALGHGASSPLPSEIDPNAPVIDMRTVLEQLEVDRVHLVGHSRGGRVALRACRQGVLPVRVASLTLFSSNMDGIAPSSERVAISDRVIAAYEERGTQFAAETWAVSDVFRGISETTRAYVVASAQRCAIRRWLSDVSIIEQASNDVRCHDIDVSTLAVTGDLDLADYEHVARCFDGTRDDHEWRRVGGTHMLPFENPSLAAAMVRDHMMRQL